MQNFNIRDLTRGLLVGLIAGIGYLIAYKIIILCTMHTSWAEQMESLGWLAAFPVLAFLFNYFSKFLKKDQPIAPIEPVAEGDEDTADEDGAEPVEDGDGDETGQP